MKNLATTGRYLFALATIGIGLVHLITGNFPSSLLPFPAFAGRQILVYIVGIVLSAGGILMFYDRLAFRAAIAVGSMFLLLFLFPHLPKLLSKLSDPGEWTVAAETLALASGAFLVANSLVVKNYSAQQANSFLPKVLRLAPYIFAISFIVFAVQHYLYAEYIATLIPAWMPAHLFLTYLVMLVFIITSFSILFNILKRNAAMIFGCMFLVMFLFLHIPRVIKNPQTETEWTSMCIALAMSGIGFLLCFDDKKRV